MQGRRDATVAIAGTAMGLAALLAIPAQIKGQSYDAILDVQSPAFFPILIALLTIVISLALLASCFLATSGKDGGADTSGDAALTPPEETGPITAPLRLTATALCLVVYFASLDLVGMIAGSTALIVVLSLVLGFRRYAIIAATALIVPAALYYAFEKGLYVMLPAGTLF